MFAQENRQESALSRGDVLLIGVVVSMLAVLINYSFVLFHTTVELFSIIVACGAFIIASSTRKFSDNHYLSFLGTAYLFIGMLDLIHTLVTPKIGVFPDPPGINGMVQFWILARYVEALTLVVAPVFFARACAVKLVFIFYLTVTSFFSWMILFTDWFPDCHLDEAGLTGFKIYSEYIISGLLLISIWLLRRSSQDIDPLVFRLMLGAISCTVVSELAFTLYIELSSLPNFVGHSLKVISFFLIYKAIIKTSLEKPYSLLFYDLKKHERQLHEANELLEQRVEDRTCDLEKQTKELFVAKDTAEAANRAKSAFLANISHEIRTPLNAILGFTDILFGRVIQPDSRYYLKSIRSSGHSLLALINNILNISKIESGTLTLGTGPMNLQQVFEKMDELFRDPIRAKGLELRMNLPERFPASLQLDESWVQQVLTNLLSNAVKFTSTGFVSLTARLENQQDETPMVDLVLEVQDSGVGIAKEEQSQIFEAFEQALGQRTSIAGTGLGLAINQRLVQRMGGELTLESELGKGSLFRVVLKKVGVFSTTQDTSSFKMASIQSKPAAKGWEAEKQDLDKLTVLVSALDQELAGTWENRGSLAMDENKGFARRVLQLARQADCKLVLDWGQGLLEETEAFRPSGVRKVMEEFPGLIEQLKQAIAKVQR